MSPSQCILVVEGNPQLPKVYTQALRADGFEVCAAATGREGLQLAREQRPGLVLLHVHLPDGSGIDVARQIKADPKLAAVMVALLSEPRSDCPRTALGPDGVADDCITSPLAPGELLARVRLLWRLHQTTLALSQRQARLRQLISEDIAKRQQAEAALQATQARTRAAEAQLNLLAHAVESTTEPICITDLQDRFIFVNQAFERTYGYTSAEILGQTPALLLSPLNPPSLLATVLEQAHAGSWQGELLDRRKDGTDFPIRLSTSQIKDPDGRVIGLIGVAQDISERKRLEQELLEISACERRRIGHELHDGLGQYLAGIAFRAKALEQMLAREASRHTARAKELTALLSNAIRQTRSVARGLDPVQVETSGLPAALQNLASEVTHFFDLTCVFRCPNPGPPVDPEVGLGLYRLTQEAVHNAIRHGEARCIEILLEWTPEHLCLRIRDNGAGFQVEERKQTGMGLRVMEYRAGSIGAQLRIASAPGRGTEVRCEVPLARCRAAAGRAGSPSPPPHPHPQSG